MLVEITILSCEYRKLRVLGNGCKRNAAARGICQPANLALTIGIEDHGALTHHHVIRRGHFGARQDECEGEESEGAKQRCTEDESTQPMPAGPTGAAAAATRWLGRPPTTRGARRRSAPPRSRSLPRCATPGSGGGRRSSGGFGPPRTGWGAARCPKGGTSCRVVRASHRDPLKGGSRTSPSAPEITPVTEVTRRRGQWFNEISWPNGPGSPKSGVGRLRGGSAPRGNSTRRWGRPPPRRP